MNSSFSSSASSRFEIRLKPRPWFNSSCCRSSSVDSYDLPLAASSPSSSSSMWRSAVRSSSDCEFDTRFPSSLTGFIEPIDFSSSISRVNSSLVLSRWVHRARWVSKLLIFISLLLLLASGFHWKIYHDRTQSELKQAPARRGEGPSGPIEMQTGTGMGTGMGMPPPSQQEDPNSISISISISGSASMPPPPPPPSSTASGSSCLLPPPPPPPPSSNSGSGSGSDGNSSPQPTPPPSSSFPPPPPGGPFNCSQFAPDSSSNEMEKQGRITRFIRFAAIELSNWAIGLISLAVGLNIYIAYRKLYQILSSVQPTLSDINSDRANVNPIETKVFRSLKWSLDATSAIKWLFFNRSLKLVISKIDENAKGNPNSSGVSAVPLVSWGSNKPMVAFNRLIQDPETQTELPSRTRGRTSSFNPSYAEEGNDQEIR